MHQGSSSSSMLSRNARGVITQMEPPSLPPPTTGNLKHYHVDELKNSISSQGDFQKLISNATELENVKLKLEMDYNSLDEELQTKDALIQSLKEDLEMFAEQEKAFETELNKVNENIKLFEKELYQKIQTTQKLEFSVEAAKKRLETLKAEVKQEQAEYDEQFKHYNAALKDLLPDRHPYSSGQKNQGSIGEKDTD